uniref:(California timema) hypothetical protein n=1 Tax=Timema californicum TaxID=61474 RepID=A0A7R9IZQ4_TIMCA|nr:unnamed protein product [Timema californicum]
MSEGGVLGASENHFEKTFTRDYRDSNLDFPIIDSLLYCESGALDHVAAEAGVKSIPAQRNPLQPSCTITRNVYFTTRQVKRIQSSLPTLSHHYDNYSSPMASLVLTDSSQLTSHTQHLGEAVIGCQVRYSRSSGQRLSGYVVNS